MGAKTKSLFPVVQHTEMDTRMCECPREANYIPEKNFLKCRDNFCQNCLRKIANPRTKSNQRLSNIPILCHIQTINFENKRSDFQKLLRAQRKSNFLEFFPSRFTPNSNDLLSARLPIISKAVTTSNLKQSVGNIPSYVRKEIVQQSHHSVSQFTTGSRVGNNFSSDASTIKGKISVDEATKCRVKDCEGFIRRAACVCVNESETKVVLVSSKNDGGGWLIPGGGLENGEEEVVAATREAWEEAGIKGRITRWLGVFQCEDDTTKKKKRTSVFVLKVAEELNDFPEANLGRVRRWFDFHEAKKRLSICKPNQMVYLDSLIK